MINVGVIGCGNISAAYLNLAGMFNGYTITACADINVDAAQARADEFDINAFSVDDMLRQPDIDLIINLTVPVAHFDVSSRCLQAGKHVYSEKPYVLSLQEGLELNQLAENNNLRIGSAPDTFLGGAHQAARQFIDAGSAGDIIGGSCAVQSAGMESWHPDPDFFFQVGGGPILDIAPYYVSNLVQLIGPVKSIVAMSSRARDVRVISSEPRAGDTIDVEVDTSVRAILQFCNGAQVSLVASWDVRSHEHNHMELYGTEQTVYVPDPNRFGDVVRTNDGEVETTINPLPALGAANFEDANGNFIANYRGIGLADMVAGIANNRPHRCNGQLALHVMEVLTGILTAAEERREVELTTTCERPAVLSDNEARSLVQAA
ncbi:MAG: Gfo/Idh/MocA family oxidoreductase [Pseudomonadota bacterium]